MHAAVAVTPLSPRRKAAGKTQPPDPRLSLDGVDVAYDDMMNVDVRSSYTR